MGKSKTTWLIPHCGVDSQEVLGCLSLGLKFLGFSKELKRSWKSGVLSLLVFRPILRERAKRV
jgi:hypothetical protein